MAASQSRVEKPRCARPSAAPGVVSGRGVCHQDLPSDRPRAAGDEGSKCQREGKEKLAAGFEKEPIVAALLTRFWYQRYHCH